MIILLSIFDCNGYRLSSVGLKDNFCSCCCMLCRRSAVKMQSTSNIYSNEKTYVHIQLSILWVRGAVCLWMVRGSVAFYLCRSCIFTKMMINSCDFTKVFFGWWLCASERVWACVLHSLILSGHIQWQFFFISKYSEDTRVKDVKIDLTIVVDPTNLLVLIP